MAGTDAHDKLVAKLLDAAEWDKDKLFGGVFALRAVVEYLEETGAPKKAGALLGQLFFLLAEASFAKEHLGKGGPKHKKLGKLASLSAAAAAVTVMKENGGQLVGRAVAHVARATGIGSVELGNFRDSLHRGTAHPLADGFYKTHLVNLRPMSIADVGAFLASVKKLHRRYL